MSRFRTRTVVVAAGLSATALVGGVVAVLSDTFTFDGNSFDSEAGRPADAQVAEVAGPGTACPTDDAAWSDGPFVGTFSADVGFSPTGSWAGTARTFCVRNQGTTTGQLSFSTEAIESTEIGNCTPYEVEAGDATCLKGAPGELLALLQLRLDPGGVATGCQNSSFYPNTVLAAGGDEEFVNLRVLPEGGACKITVTPQAGPSTLAVRQRAESDRAVFAFTLTLRDATL